MVAAIAVTEPDAGSDVAGIKTRAVRDGDDWVINGSKIYITNAATADWLCLLAVTDPEAGYGGFSQIVVPTDSPGFSYQLLDKIGNWGSDTGLLFFEDVRVPVANTIGDIGRGFQQQMMQFQDERLVACVSSNAGVGGALGGDPRVLRGAHASSGSRSAKMQVTQFKFVEMLTQITAAQELTYALHPQAHARRGRDQGDLDGEALHAAAWRACVADNCIQLHGGFGYMKESAAGRAFVDTRLISIGGGADEVMIHYLAKMLGF